MLLQERGWQAIQRVLNQSTGQQLWEALSAAGVRVEHTTAGDLLRGAELIEVSEANPGPNNATLSLGDALILSVGERLDCPVITRDIYWGWMVTNGIITTNVIVP